MWHKLTNFGVICLTWFFFFFLKWEQGNSFTCYKRFFFLRKSYIGPIFLVFLNLNITSLGIVFKKNYNTKFDSELNNEEERKGGKIQIYTYASSLPWKISSCKNFTAFRNSKPIRSLPKCCKKCKDHTYNTLIVNPNLSLIQ